MKTIKRTLAVVLTLLMLATAMPLGVMNASAAEKDLPIHYTVMLLDVSLSMEGEPLEMEKAAAIKNDTVEIRTAVKEQFTSLSDTVQKLVTSLNDLYGSSIGAVNTARDLIDDGLDIVSEDEE